MRLIDNEGQRAKIVLNLIVLAIALFGLSRRKFDFSATTGFERLMIETFAPVQRSITYLNESVSDFFTNYISNVNSSKQNAMLRKKIAELEGQIDGLQELSRENNRLKDLLQFGEELHHEKVLAQIVAWDASSDFKVLRINKGINHGIKLQSPVVTASGLVGYVYRLTSNYADVMTILDTNNRIDAVIKRTRTHSILEGYSKGKCLAKYVTRTEPIVLNDEFVTSGLGKIYPKGIKVGKVTRIERESYGVTQYVEVSPSVDFSRLEEVVVLVSTSTTLRDREWEILDGAENLKGKQ